MPVVLCSHCNGYGSSLKDTGNPNAPCSKCNGAGAIRVPREGEMAGYRPVTLAEAFEMFNIKPQENRKEG